jgi:hypothetical protein
MGENSDSNRKQAVPQTDTLPIELYSPFVFEGVIRTPTCEYQKFRTYLLVNFEFIESRT